MDDANVEQSIVDDSPRRDANPAAVLPRVADGSEHDRLRSAVDPHGAWLEARQHPDDGIEVNGGTAKEPHVLVRVTGDLGVEAQSRHAEVTEIVGQRDVDLAWTSAHRQLARGIDVTRDAQDAGEVIAGAERDH